jgi:uncharacterized membrane protein YqhA
MPTGGQPGEPTPGEVQRGGGLFEGLLKFRYVAVLVVVIALLHSLTFLAIATRSAFITYWHVVRGTAGGETAQRPGLELLHSLDLLLVALVLMILGLGVAKLFLLPAGSPHRPTQLPAWLDVESFSELKYLLWETILTTLLVAALSIFTAGIGEKLEWSALLLPAAILLLALSLYFMKKA